MDESWPELTGEGEAERFRARYFAPGDQPRWEAPGSGFVSAHLAKAIAKFAVAVPSVRVADCADVFQTVYGDLWARFTLVVGKFEDKYPRRTLKLFENYLNLCLTNAVTSAFRKLKTRTLNTPVEIGDDPPQASDSERAEHLERWRREVYGELSATERMILEDRLVHDLPAPAIAEKLGLKTSQVHKQACEARLKFRMGMIRRVFDYHLSRRPALETRWRVVMAARCELRHVCYLYRVECPSAFPIAVSARLVPLSEGEVDLRLRELEARARDVLDDWDLNDALNRCLWAKSPRA